MSGACRIRTDDFRYYPGVPYSDPEDQRRAARAHYAANKAIYKARAAAHRKKTRDAARAQVQGIKESSPCVDCGVRYPYFVMQFDHRGTDKLFDIARAVGDSVPFQRILDEIAKCDLVCANCHAFRTHGRAASVVAREGFEPSTSGL